MNQPTTAVPPYTLGVVTVLLMSYLSDRYRSRAMALVVSGGLSAVGYSILYVSEPDTGDSENRGSGSSQTKSSSALECFSDYEPGGSQDTSDGGSGWWAERLLRDLLEGIVAETVVKSGSTATLLLSNTNLSSNSDHSEMSCLSSQNNSRHYTSDKTSASDRKAANHITNSPL
ncbi:hypothetical protein PGTUg99_007917 [Puccinia graminis f. sp. tritici]|uniref:Uncharacterized protein n=1 Tax=Puccinia graminis f. sp. tritici TaxID=56615 RepID=A0A5B0RCL7_PUCGR|nr:hypothetical protein PGTUg99_007917 [Puccinia graminis f. sp. tritici]